MSLIPDLGENYSKLPSILEAYENALIDYEENIKIEGKLLEHANREQAAWQSFYDQKRLELYTLVKYFEGQINKVRGILYKRYTENYSRELSDRLKDKYIDKEEEYLNIFEIYLEVKELYNKYESIVETFKSRGYALNNITKIRVAALEDVTI